MPFSRPPIRFWTFGDRYSGMPLSCCYVDLEINRCEGHTVALLGSTGREFYTCESYSLLENQRIQDKVCTDLTTFEVPVSRPDRNYEHQ